MFSLAYSYICTVVIYLPFANSSAADDERQRVRTRTTTLPFANGKLKQQTEKRIRNIQKKETTMATRNFVQKEAGTIAYQLREKHDLRGEGNTDNPALAVSVVGGRTVTAAELAKEIALYLSVCLHSPTPKSGHKVSPLTH